MTLTDFRPLPDPDRRSRRTPTADAAHRLQRIKTQQLARELARTKQAARETAAWSEGDD